MVFFFLTSPHFPEKTDLANATKFLISYNEERRQLVIPLLSFAVQGLWICFTSRVLVSSKSEWATEDVNIKYYF